MSRKFKITIPNIAEFKFGKNRNDKFIEVATGLGATTVSSFRDTESKKIVITFSATKLQAAAIEQALNALNSD